jgi:uncharacterized protein (UPF0332 family)
MTGNMDEAQRWLNRASSSLAAAKVLLAQQLYEDAISRAYYAMFQAANALLISDGIEVSGKHSAVIAAFGRQYVKTGKVDAHFHQMLIQDFEWRQKSDYNVYWIATQDITLVRVNDASQFIELIKELVQKGR